MSFDEFIQAWTGKDVDFDGIYKNQCMDLMHQYIYDVLGITDGKVLAAPAAYQVYANFQWDTLFDKIDNSPTGVPTKGDIVFFGQKIGQYGHVCIFIEGSADKFKSFDANWPLNTLPHIQDHTYNGCLGWLRFKQQEQMVTIPSKELDDIRFRRDELFNQNQTLIGKEGEQQHEILELQNANKTLNDKIADLSQAIEKDALEDSDTMVKLVEAGKKQNEYLKDLEKISNAMGVAYPPVESILDRFTALSDTENASINEFQKLYDYLFNNFVRKGKQTTGIVKRILNFIVRG